MNRINSYTGEEWRIGEAITKIRMDRIEQGIESAFAILQEKPSSGGYNGTLQNLKDYLENKITNLDVSQLTEKVNTALQNSIDGSVAWKALSAAGVIYDDINESFTYSLKTILDNKAPKSEFDALKVTIGDANSGLIKTVNTHTSSIRSIDEIIAAIKGNIDDSAAARINRMDNTIDRLEQNISDFAGTAAGTAYGANGTLVERLTAIDSGQNLSQYTKNGTTTTVSDQNIPSMYDEIVTARGTVNGVARANLNARFDSDETAINNLKTEVTNARKYQVWNSTSEQWEDIDHTQSTLDARLDNIDDGKLSSRTLPSLGDEVNEAHRNLPNDNSGNPQTDTLKKRFDNIETITGLNSYNSSVNGTMGAAITNLRSEIINAHRTGLEDGNGVPINDNLQLRFEQDEARITNTETEIDRAIDTVVYGAGDKGGLKQRMTAVEAVAAAAAVGSETTTAIEGLDGRLDILEDNVNGAKVQDGPQTLDARFDAVESRATTLETKVTNIANELSMTNIADQVLDTTSRIDTLETNVVAMANEIGMLQNGAEVQNMASAITGATTRIDSLETEVGEAHRTHSGHFEEDEETHEQVELDDTLDLRFDDIESDIDDINDKIGGNYDSSNTVTAAIEAAITTAETYTDTQNTNNKVAQINDANREHSGHFVEDEETHEQVEVSDTLNLRFNDIEERLDAIDTPSTGVIAGLDGRIDDIETELTNARIQIGTDNEDQPIMSTLDQRLDTIDNAISHTKDANDDNDLGGLTERITAAESAIRNKASITDLSTLSSTVSNISTTVVLATNQVNFTAQASGNVPRKPATLINATVVDKDDYLIQDPDDNLYYYWKHINGEWYLMGGAGSSNSGTGNSNAEDYETVAAFEAAVKEINKDYYVLESDNVRHHYRYLKSLDEDEQEVWTKIEIGQVIDPDILKTYNIAIQSVKENNETNSYLYLFDFDAGENNHPTDAIINQRIANNDYVNKVKLPAGGGSGTVNLMQIRQITPVECTAAINSGEPTLLRFFFTTGEVGGKGYYNITIDGKKVYDTDQLINGGNPANAAWEWPTKEVDGNTVDMTLEEGAALGFYALDVSDYCTSLKDYNVRLDIRLMTNRDITANAEWTLRVMNFQLTSSAPEGLILSTEDTTSIKYTPHGAIQKTLHIVIDDNLEQEELQILGSTINGREREYAITQSMSHGVHKISMWMTANASGIPLTSNTIVREYIWYNPNITNAIILASPMRGKTTTASAYSEINIPYSVYNTNTGYYTVEYYLNYGTENQQLISTDQLHGNINTSFTYIPTTATANPEHPDIFTIKVGETTLNMQFIITAITQEIGSVPGAIIDFDPAQYNNNSINREPTWSDYSMTVSDNFNWSTSSGDSGGGYREDADGKCFIIKAGSYVDINYPFFKPKTGTVFTNGAEMKIIFKTSAVRSADATWFTSLGTLQSKTVGIQLNTHNGWLKTNKAVDYDAADTEEEYDVWVSGKTDYALNDIVIYRKKTTDSYIIYKYIKKCKNYTIMTPDEEGMSGFWASLADSAWVSGTAYKKGNIVSVNNTVYQCIVDLIDEVQSISPADDTEQTYWKIIISPWESNTQYKVGNIVTISDEAYLCKQNVTEGAALTLDPPSDTNGDYWTKINEWTSGNTYKVDAVVIYNDIMYKCTKDVVNQFVQTPKDLASKNWLAMGMTQDKIIATNSYLYFPYSENDKIELDININQYDATKKNNFIMSYEDGVPSKAYAYDAKTGGDSLLHTSNIRIGSPDCDVYIYKLRIYNKSLTDEEILKNFIADGKTVKEKIDRYERNCIYCDEYNQFSLTDEGSARLDPIKLAEKMPNVKVLMLDTPRFTTGKKDFVKGSSLRCLQIKKDDAGNFIYPEEGNWFFQNGLHAGQGTTSDNYGQAGRNVDFLFECDGKHWPTKEKNIKDTFDLKGADKNYISSVLRGNSASKWNATTQTWEPTSVYNDDTHQWEPSEILTTDELTNWTAQPPEYCEDWKGDTCKVALTPTSVPNNYFNLKVNIASSENVNNALFQKRYNDYVAYQSPAKEKQIAKHGEAYEALGIDLETLVVKNGMEFVPAVLFIREYDETIANHTEFKDCEWHFYALGNIGDSKKSDYTRAYDPDDMNEYTVENSDNNTNNGQFQSGVYFKNNNHDVRYIETEYDSWSNQIAYKTGAKVIYNGQLYIRTSEDMVMPTLAEGEELNLRWVAEDWTLQQITITYDSLSIDWQADKTYSIGNLVYRNNVLYRYKDVVSSSDSTWDASKWESAEITYLEDDLLYHNGQLYRYIGAENEEKTSWVAADWSIVETKLAGITYLNPMEYIYPIASEEWNTKYSNKYINNRHQTLVGEDFDGDHSFEFRYACKGDYRDGDLINDTNGDSDIVDPEDSTKFLTKDTVQFTLNQKVFYAFYEWLITTPRNKFRAEAPLWFVPSAMEFFYAFTHYYTMMDNRAKNTFWHFAKTDTRKAVPIGKAFEQLMHIYEESDGNGGYQPATGAFDNTKQYYTQYAFDLWVYDTDTAAGIDNNGALIFPYGKEDEDYRVDGDPNSGYAFNGAGSIFWRRLKDPAEKGGFEDGIIEVMSTAKTNCFSSSHLINQFDEFQSCYPEEIWRLDIQRKYIRTFTGVTQELTYDNAVAEGKQNTRFLTSMMQGRKKYQRRQWIRDQGVYFNSKYKLPEITGNTNEYSVTLGADPESLDVPVDYTLKLTPYQDMYLNIVLGNGTPVPSVRAKAGVEYPIPIPTSGSVQETRVYIQGGDYLSGISNLAPMYPYSLMFSHIAHLKKFDMGTNIVGYVNTKLAEQGITSLGDGGGPLLEEVNVKNCHSLATFPSLEKSNNLRVIEAEGTAISGVTLPDYTNIEILHLPNTIQELSLHNAINLKDFYMKNNLQEEDYSNLYTLSLINSDQSNKFTWKYETKYNIGDMCMIGSNYYKCKIAHTSLEEPEEGETIDSADMEQYIETNWTLVKSNIYVPVDWMAVANSMISKQSYNTIIDLQELSSATIGDIQELIDIGNFKEPLENNGGTLNLNGVINVKGYWSEMEAKVYTNDIGYYTTENNNTIWNPVITDPRNYNTNPLWPELRLIIDPNKRQIKWPVTYNYNGTSKTLYINNGATAPDIYFNGEINMPSQVATPRVTYQFGSRDDLQGNYIEYSGWKLSSSNIPLTTAPIIDNVTILDAYFEEIDRYYYIRWYRKQGDTTPINTSEAEKYGGGYTLENPKIEDIHKKGYETCEVTIDNTGMVTYSIFTGWNRLPININPDGRTPYFDIYGVWETNTLSLGDLFADTTNLTPVQLLVLSQLTDQQKTTYHISDAVDVSTCMTYKLGHDNTTEEYQGSVIQADNITPFYLNGSNTQVYTSYQPLLANEDAFTFAIDFALSSATYTQGKNFATIVSCYHSAGGVRSGFGIFKNISTGAIEVGFGDMYKYSDQRVAISNSATSTMRNIVVLRHPKGSPSLYIYSGLNSGTGMPITEPYYNKITRRGETEFNSNAKLNIGTLVGQDESIDNSDTILNTWTRAVGTIYWAKYWKEDLGIGECKRLATWPHEYITLGIAHSYRDPNAEINNKRAQDNVLPNPTLYLATRNTLTHGQVVQDRKNYQSFVNDRYNWEMSDVRTLCNNRILHSLPTTLQAILCKPNVYTYPIEYYIEYDNQNNPQSYTYKMAEYTEATRDYVYAYSGANILPDGSIYDNEDIDMSPFDWRIPTNVTLYNYNASDSSWYTVTYNPNNDDGRAQYLNIRFPYAKAFTNSTIRVFKIENGSSISNIAESIGVSNLRNGDIYIEGAIAYIYVSNKDINAYGLSNALMKDYARFNGLADSIVVNIGGGAGKGGWIAANNYWTRDLIQNGTQWTAFSDVEQDGRFNNDIISTSVSAKVNYILAI